MRIVVDIPPLLSIVKTLAPPDAEITLITPPGAPAHGYEPGPRTVAAIMDADLVVLSTRGLSPTVDRLVDATQKPHRSLVFMAETEHSHDHHGHEGHAHAHDDVGVAHPWLEPLRMKAFVAQIAMPIGQFVSEQEMPQESAALQRVESLCDEVDALYRESLAPYAGQGIVVIHDAWSDLADAYGFRIAAIINLAEGAEPTPSAVTGAIEALKSGDASAIAVEPQFTGRIADRLVELTGAPVVVLDPLGDGDWEALMRSNLDALVEAFSAAPSAGEAKGAQ